MSEIMVKVIQRVWEFLKNTKHRVNLIYGGAGAGKSFTVAQHIILNLFLKEKDKYILITRKTNPSLRLTAYRLVLSLLEQYHIPYEHHKADQILVFRPHGNFIFFRGLDDPEKIKSAEFNYIWMEEATEFSLEEYQQLKLRLRRHTARIRNQMFLTFNPIPCWIKEYFFDSHREEDVGSLKLTYKDNPFLAQEYIHSLESLKEQDKTYYTIYALGEFAIPENLIYTNWDIVNTVPKVDEIMYGVDFGYNNPTVVLKIGIKDKEVYILDEIYQTHMTNADLIEMLKKFVHVPNAYIFCDSSEPQRIEELRRARFNAFGGTKDVKQGIDLLKRTKIHIFHACVNTIKEIKLYRWKQDHAGNILDEPLKINDHAMDALRYVFYGYCSLSKPSIVTL